jgi:antitoxin protein of toxin-antitoxin system
VSFLDKAKEFADKHDKHVDQILEKVGDEVDKRTGHKYSQHIDRGVDEAQRRTGDGDTRPQTH